MITLSPSKLNLLEECPRCFWLDVRKGVRRPQGLMASIVIKIDSIIKKYFDKYEQRGELPPIIRGQVRGRLPSGMPKTLYYDYGEVRLMGRPDEFLELDDGCIVPFDHKTKSKEPEEVHNAYLLQMDVYSFLLMVKGYKTTDKAYLAYYYPCDCDVHDGLDVNCKVVEVRTSFDRAKRVIDKAVRVLEGDIPKPSSECEFCRWKGEL